MGSHSQTRDPRRHSDTCLPASKEDWDVVESNFRFKCEKDRLERLADAEKQWHESRSAAESHIRGLQDRIRKLQQEECSLSRKLVSVQSETSSVIAAHNESTQRLEELAEHYSSKRQKLLQKGQDADAKMRVWFKEKRGRCGVDEMDWQPEEEYIDQRPLDRRLPSLSNLQLPGRSTGDDRIVAFVDAQGTIVDRLGYLGLSNDRTIRISALSVLRPVELRNRFVADDVTKIYDCRDGTGSGWIACMIQATGVVQETKCQGCEQRNGLFQHCVSVDAEPFPKCGNCEWNGQECRAASIGRIGPESRFLPPPQRKPLGISTSPKFDRLLQSPPLTAAGAVAEAGRAAAAAYEVAWKSPPPSGFKALNRPPATQPPSPPEESSASPNQYNTSLVESYKTTYTDPRQPTPSFSKAVDDGTDNAGPEITQKTLILQHNGTFYTYPKCIEGVPLEKIDPHHPYWDPKWPDLRVHVQPILNAWKEKHQAAKTAEQQGHKAGSARYQYNRQVNRGDRILQFLKHGSISPYQLLSKRFMSVGKGSISSYDTLFRLCETIYELEQYPIDVTPVEWLRQRLHELIEVQGAGFNFSKTIHNFYSDKKLKALREKAGKKNIGRPAHSSMRRGSTSGSASRNETPRPPKRKSPHFYGTPSPAAESMGRTAESAGDERRHGDRRQEEVVSVLNSLETEEVSDTDSFSGDAILDLDFRLYQVKSRVLTSSEEVTQYWRWIPHLGIFEHQVLKGMNPVSWGVHREPIDFSLRLADVVKVAWNLKALRVYLVMSDRHICFEDDKPRGDVMVAFKRANTMRRFIKFCRTENLELVEETL